MIKSRMLDVKENFKRMHEPNLICDLCQNELENQVHLFKCKAYTDYTENIKVGETMKYILENNKLEIIQ